jgi:uncharacterized protein YoaH (UPF0181 family)
MTQEQKAAAWDKLMQLMAMGTMDNIVIENLRNDRRANCRMTGKWEAYLPAGIKGPRPIDLYRGPDAIAALDALIDPPTP